MKITKNDETLILSNEGDVIEKYNLSDEINFKGLATYLLHLNLSNKVEQINDFEELNENEKTLILIINEIIELYNKKVDELEVFNSSLKADKAKQ